MIAPEATKHFTLCFLNAASNNQSGSCIWLFSEAHLVLVANLYVTTEHFTLCFLNVYLFVAILLVRVSVVVASDYFHLVLVANLYVATEYFTLCFLNVYLILTARLSDTNSMMRNTCKKHTVQTFCCLWHLQRDRIFKLIIYKYFKMLMVKMHYE